MAVTRKTTKKGASKRPAGSRAALLESAATPPPSAVLSDPHVTVAPLPPSVLFAERLRRGDASGALADIKETSLKALYEHGLLEHYHLLDDVLNDRIMDQAVVPGVGIINRRPTIDQKLQAYKLMLAAANRRAQGGPNALPFGDQVKWGVIFLPTPDPAVEGFVEGPHPNGNGHRAA